MSAFPAPFGLKPLYHPSGVIRPKASDVASGYATNLFMYTPVNLAPGTGTGLVIAAGSPIAGPAVGSFLGVEFTPSTGRRQYQPWWPGNQVAQQIVAYYTDDQLITYEVQANGSVNESHQGNQANMTAEAGNLITGFSTSALDVATLTNSGNALVKIIGLSYGPLNAWGDAYTIVQVQIANHTFTATRVAQ